MKRSPASASASSTRKRKKRNESNGSPSSSKTGTILDFFPKSKQRKPSSPMSSLPKSASAVFVATATSPPRSFQSPSSSSPNSLSRISSNESMNAITSTNPSHNTKAKMDCKFGTPATPPPMTPTTPATPATRATSTVVSDDSDSNPRLKPHYNGHNAGGKTNNANATESNVGCGTPVSPEMNTAVTFTSKAVSRVKATEKAGKNLGTPQTPPLNNSDNCMNSWGERQMTPPSPPSERSRLGRGGANSEVETPPSPMNLSDMDTPCSPPTTETEWRRYQLTENEQERKPSGNEHAKQASDGRNSLSPSNGYKLNRQSSRNSPPFKLGTPSPAASSKTKPTKKNTKPPRSSPLSSSSSKRKPVFQSSNNSQQQYQTKKSHQFYLDFGQSNFGKQTICGICGMLRVHGLEEDDVQHAKICREFQEGVAFLGWKTERRVWGVGEERIVEIRPSDPPQHRKKVMEVKAIVDAELGFSSTACSKTNPLQDMTCYLYTSKKRIVGLLLVKHLKRAYELISAETNDGSGENNYESDNKQNEHSKHQKDSFSRSLKPSKAMMGVHQIWCHRSHRKSGIASRLCDTARSCLVFGMTVPVEYVAFSSPTLDGVKFAKSYLGTERPLVYDMS